MNLPTKEQCLLYFKEYKVPQNIVNHCLMVSKASLFLAKELNKLGKNYNLNIVEALALLHDLFKVVVLKELDPHDEVHSYPYNEDEILMWKKLREKYHGKYENEVAYEVFKDEFPELALALKTISNPFLENKSQEEFLVHYCDWRVLKSQIIPLNERLIYLRERYPLSVLRHEEINFIKEYEEELFNNLSYLPSELGIKMDLVRQSLKETERVEGESENV